MARPHSKTVKVPAPQPPSRSQRSSHSQLNNNKSTNVKLEISDSDDSSIRVSMQNIDKKDTFKVPLAPNTRPTKVSSSGSPSASGSLSMASTPRDVSSDYETADTTPAMSIRGGSSLKRKRDSGLKAEEEDAALALKLQQEEYTLDSGASKRVKHQGTSLFSDESELSGLSELSEAESLSDAMPLQTRRKLASSNLKIARAARSAAQASIKKVMKKVQVELTDSEELSVFDYEGSFIEDEDDSGEADSEEDIAVPTASAVASARVRGRRHGNVTAAAAQSAGQTIGRIVHSRRAGRKQKERLKLETAHPEIKTMWQDLEKIPIIKPVPAAQPDAITRKLKSFQLEGLDWLVKQEQSTYKGGLLGDEMGMGKTIQAVSLIMSDYPQKQPSLVVVPPVALMQWSAEIGEYTNGKLNVLVYHGQNNKIKTLKVKDLQKYDVIMISYNSLESLYRKQTKGWTRGEDIIKEDSPIHAIHFHRLILDEAHCIKTRTTGVAKACFALKGTYKWCLSGTPVQNRIGEFFSLLRFLEVRPFADYFCKHCDCAMTHWAVDAKHNCVGCGHTGMEHVSVFNQELLNPLTESLDATERNAAMAKLHMITARIMLRRVKKDYTSSMELPPKEVIVSSNFFGDVEKDFSTSIMSNTERQFNTYVSRNVVLNNYANIFGLIMQMRQVANHPDLILRKNAAEGQNVLACQLCDEVAEDAIRSQCKHDFCRTCVKSYMTTIEATGVDPDCPRCHIPLAIDLEQPEIEQDEDHVKKSSIINRIKMEDWTSSTKIEMLVYELYKLRSKKQTTKSIVFSNFTSMLQLVEWRLRRAGFNTVMLDGSMTPIQRQRSIEYFMTNPTVEVFLVSLKAGGVALNLTEASRVFIVDPWWNPAAEWQSADRCHRIGQRRPCVITRLCIEDSVESRMVMLQEKKANMINSTINNDKASFDKLTPEDMQFLFRGS